MTDDKKCTIASIDFRGDKTITRLVTVDHDRGAAAFLRKMADLAARSKVQSVIVVTIEEGDVVDHWLDIISEQHKALAALYLDDVKDDLKSQVFNEVDLDEDEGDAS